MRVDTQCALDEGIWRVSVRVGLDREESSRLFLLGDILMSWPTEGLVGPASGAPLVRGCMYLSEIQSRATGLVLAYGSESQARHALAAIVAQLESAGRRLAGKVGAPDVHEGEAAEGDMQHGSSARQAAATEGAAAASRRSGEVMRDLVAEYAEMPGVAAVLLISDEGLLVASIEKEPVDSEAIAALVADTVVSARRFGRAAGLGPLDTMALEYQDAGLFLAPFTEDVVLVLVKNR